MAKTIEQLKAQSAEVKNASVIGENTATRVGSLFNDIVEHVEAYEAGQTADTEANTLAISNETTARVKADDGLNAAIVAEKNRAEAAEEANAQAIEAETARAMAAETTLSERVNQEVTDRKAMDETIGIQLSNEIERAKGMELGISTKLNDEIERAQEAENNLQEKITSEAEARDLAINTEAQARTQNDQLLSQAISAEQERAEAAELANTTAINTTKSLLQETNSIIGDNMRVPIQFIDGKFFNFSGEDLTDVKIDTTNLTPHRSFRYAIVPCKKGDVYDIHTYVDTRNSFPAAFTDSDYKIYFIARGSQRFDRVLVAPTDGFLILNDRGGEQSYKGTDLYNLFGIESIKDETSSAKINSISNTYDVNLIDITGDITFNTNIKLTKTGNEDPASSGVTSSPIEIDKGRDYYLTTSVDKYRVGVAYYEDADCQQNVGIDLLSASAITYTQTRLNVPFAAKYMKICSAGSIALYITDYEINDLATLEDDVASIKARIDNLPNVVNAVTYHQKQKIYAKDAIINVNSIATTSSSRWSLVDGILTCAAGTDRERYTFNTLPVNGGRYIISITQNSGNLTDGFFVYMGNIKLDPYNGDKDMFVGYISDGEAISLEPKTDGAFSIALFKVQEIGDVNDYVDVIDISVFNINNGNSAASNITGKWNVAIGPTETTFANNIDTSRSIAIGHEAMKQIQTGLQNIAIGTFALNKVKRAERVIAIGSDTAYGKGLIVINDSIAVGKAAMSCDTIDTDITIKECIAIGGDAMSSPKTNVVDSITIGQRSQRDGGSYDVSIGVEAGRNGGDNNVMLGHQAGVLNDSNDNVAIGYKAYRGDNAKGVGNVIIGSRADFNSGMPGALGNNSIAIGFKAKTYGDNSIAIGANTINTKSNQVIIGNAQVEEVIIGSKKIIFNADRTCTWEEV